MDKNGDAKNFLTMWLRKEAMKNVLAAAVAVASVIVVRFTGASTAMTTHAYLLVKTHPQCDKKFT
jgi:hypothetical protein